MSRSTPRYTLGQDRKAIYRTVRHISGRVTTRRQPVTDDMLRRSEDLAAAFDLSWLGSLRKPAYGRPGVQDTMRLADLFSGAGGLTLGALEAGRAVGRRIEPAFGADMMRAAREVYCANFRPGAFEDRAIEEYVDGSLGCDPTRTETALMDRLGKVHLVVAGPPCQGHSNLNNHTRRDDPKNRLYERVVRFVELFEPDHVIIENVHAAIHDKGRIVERSKKYLEAIGYETDLAVLYGDRVGVPQTRNRVFLVASTRVKPTIREWERLHAGSGPRSFEWACKQLKPSGDPDLDRATEPKGVTRQRIEYLFRDDKTFDLPDALRPPCHRDKAHSYRSVYGRIRGKDPAPTITTGFTVMGQGRFVHPNEKRTLTPREGARLQFFPDWFSFSGGRRLSRSELVTLIGNAVPPKMAYVLAVELLR